MIAAYLPESWINLSEFGCMTSCFPWPATPLQHRNQSVCCPLAARSFLFSRPLTYKMNKIGPNTDLLWHSANHFPLSQATTHSQIPLFDVSVDNLSIHIPQLL